MPDPPLAAARIIVAVCLPVCFCAWFGRLCLRCQAPHYGCSKQKYSAHFSSQPEAPTLIFSSSANKQAHCKIQTPDRGHSAAFLWPPFRFSAARARAVMSGINRSFLQHMSSMLCLDAAAERQQPPNRSQSSSSSCGKHSSKQSSSLSSLSSSREILTAPSASAQPALRASFSNDSLPVAATEAKGAIAEAEQHAAVYGSSQTQEPSQHSPRSTQQNPQLITGFAARNSILPRRCQQQLPGKAALRARPSSLTLSLAAGSPFATASFTPWGAQPAPPVPHPQDPRSMATGQWARHIEAPHHCNWDPSWAQQQQEQEPQISRSDCKTEQHSSQTARAATFGPAAAASSSSSSSSSSKAPTDVGTGASEAEADSSRKQADYAWLLKQAADWDLLDDLSAWAADCEPGSTGAAWAATATAVLREVRQVVRSAAVGTDHSSSGNTGCRQKPAARRPPPGFAAAPQLAADGISAATLVKVRAARVLQQTAGSALQPAACCLPPASAAVLAKNSNSITSSAAAANGSARGPPPGFTAGPQPAAAVLTTAPQSAAPQSALDPAVFAAFVQAARAPQQQQRSQLPQQPAARGPPPGFGGAVQAGGQQGQCKGNSRTQPMAVPQVAGRKGSRAGGLESSLLQQVHSILSSLRRERQRVCRA